MKPLTENLIRPAQLMADQRMAFLTDVGRLLSRCNEFISVDCPACGSGESSPRFEKNGFSYVECCQCQTLYINPRPSAQLLQWFYQGSANYKYWNEVIFPVSESARLEHIFVPRIERLLGLCRKYDVNNGALIEIGAGFGTFCAELQKRKVFSRVVAVEPVPGLADTCRGRGLEVLPHVVEEIPNGYEGMFDVVASFEVIEHLFSPGLFIKQAGRLLKPGGLMLLTCPNGKGFDIECLGNQSDTVDHEHLNYFNPQSISSLLNDCGFKVLEIVTPGRLDTELVRNKILAGVFDVSGQPFLKKVLMDDWERLGNAFQQFLADNQLSSNLWVAASRL